MCAAGTCCCCQNLLPLLRLWDPPFEEVSGMVSGEEDRVEFSLRPGPSPYILCGQLPISIINKPLSKIMTCKHIICLKESPTVRLRSAFTVGLANQIANTHILMHLLPWQVHNLGAEGPISQYTMADAPSENQV